MLSNFSLTKFNFSKTLEYFLMAFLIIQPVFDLKIFYNSTSTLIRVIVICLLFITYFFLSNNKKKYYLLIYPFLIFIYFIFHHINAMNFNSLVPGNFNYSILKEGLYFAKMLTPFLLIYCLYKSNLTFNNILIIIKCLVCVIGLTVIISNIFMFSYGSYSDQIIKANFLSWFNNNGNYTYQDLASKGLFEYANQIGAILLIFLPFTLSSFMHDKKILNLLILIINIFSLFLLGTKVAVLGIFIVFFYTIFVHIFYIKFITKQKLLFNSIMISAVLLLLYSLILPSNPMFIRMDEDKIIAASSIPISTTETNTFENATEELSSDNSTNLTIPAELQSIKKEFITQSYPYEYDSEFWLQFIDEPLSNKVNYRYIEQAMVERVVKINNNKYDKYLGITNTRLQNIFNIERDFLVQYYAIGIIGLILVFSPYFALLLFYLFTTIKNKLKSLTIENTIAFISILLAFGISYFSGNLLNSLSFTIYFSLLFIGLLHTDAQN